MQPAERLTLSAQGIRARRLRMLNAYSPPAPYRRSSSETMELQVLLMVYILHYLTDPKLRELRDIPYYG